jgi:hypothetical protein
MDKHIDDKPRRKMGPGLSRAEFSRLSDIPLRQLDRMIAAKQIKVVPIGTLRRIPYSELERIQDEMGPSRH